MSRRVRIASAVLLSLLACVEAHSQSYLGRRLLTIPVEINNIAGTFLIDTGADRTVIDSAFAQRLGLKPSGAVSPGRLIRVLEKLDRTGADQKLTPYRRSAPPASSSIYPSLRWGRRFPRGVSAEVYELGQVNASRRPGRAVGSNAKGLKPETE